MTPLSTASLCLARAGKPPACPLLWGCVALALRRLSCCGFKTALLKPPLRKSISALPHRLEELRGVWRSRHSRQDVRGWPKLLDVALPYVLPSPLAF